jgi:Nickel responsive protein SCO4226-like
MASIIVEYSFDEPKTDDELSEMAKRLDTCLDVRNGAWVRSSLSGDRKRMICEFEAPDAESVREALRWAKQTFDRVWPAQVFAVENYPELHAKVRALRSKASA